MPPKPKKPMAEWTLIVVGGTFDGLEFTVPNLASPTNWTTRISQDGMEQPYAVVSHDTQAQTMNAEPTGVLAEEAV
jgi:hypothetical protein